MKRPISGMVPVIPAQAGIQCGPRLRGGDKQRRTGETKNPRSSSGASSRAKSRLLLDRLDRHGVLRLGTLLAVLHVTRGGREQRVVLADAHVHAGLEGRAA